MLRSTDVECVILRVLCIASHHGECANGASQERRIMERNRTLVCLGNAVEACNLSHLKDICGAQVGGLLLALCLARVMVCIPLGTPKRAEVCCDARPDTSRWIWGIVALD